MLAWLVSTAIGLGRLHHSVVGTVELVSGLFGGQGQTKSDFLHVLVWTTLGNALGSILCVGHRVWLRDTEWRRSA